MANPLMVKGNQLAKGNSGGGRKTLSEELLKRALEIKKEEIAKELHNGELVDMKENGYTHEQMKDFVMPVIVKGMADKKELSGTVILETITGMKIQLDGHNFQDQNNETNTGQ